MSDWWKANIERGKGAREALGKASESAHRGADVFSKTMGQLFGAVGQVGQWGQEKELQKRGFGQEKEMEDLRSRLRIDELGAASGFAIDEEELAEMNRAGILFFGEEGWAKFDGAAKWKMLMEYRERGNREIDWAHFFRLQKEAEDRDKVKGDFDLFADEAIINWRINLTGGTFMIEDKVTGTWRFDPNDEGAKGAVINELIRAAGLRPDILEKFNNNEDLLRKAVVEYVNNRLIKERKTYLDEEEGDGDGGRGEGWTPRETIPLNQLTPEENQEARDLYGIVLKNMDKYSADWNTIRQAYQMIDVDELRSGIIGLDVGAEKKREYLQQLRDLIGSIEEKSEDTRKYY